MPRSFFLLCGFLFLGLAVIGAILPLMPTTIFVILAAGCFTRSSPRLEQWLLDHSLFGPTLRRWRENHAIPPVAKGMAVGGMTIGLAGFIYGAEPPAWGIALAFVFIAACAGYVLTRPSA